MARPRSTLVTSTPGPVKGSMPTSTATAGERLTTVAPSSGLRPLSVRSSRAGVAGGASARKVMLSRRPSRRTIKETRSPGRCVPTV